MSTALLYCGTPEGFVIGADGRAFNKLTKRVETDDERKIFVFENRDATIVFAWAGIVKTFIPDDSYFSLVETTYDLLPHLNFNGFFAQEFNARLKEKVSLLRTNDSGRCATGIFLSYRKSRPWVSQITVYKNGRTWDCGDADEGDPNGEIDLVSGPSRMFEKPKSLFEAENVITTYLKDCAAHPTEKVGGQIQIGKLTPEGFRWAFLR